VLKRTAHLTVQVAERPLKIARVAEATDASAKPARARKTAAESGAKKSARKAAAKA
jgi:hypothetical protein